jgi:hypothetical protein
VGEIDSEEMIGYQGISARAMTGDAPMRAWFRICHFWVTQARVETTDLCGLDCDWKGGCSMREATGFLGSSSLGLEISQAQQGEPVRMTLPGHQLPRTSAVALGTAAPHEAPMVQEELQ